MYRSNTAWVEGVEDMVRSFHVRQPGREADGIKTTSGLSIGRSGSLPYQGSLWRTFYPQWPLAEISEYREPTVQIERCTLSGPLGERCGGSGGSLAQHKIEGDLSGLGRGCRDADR